MKNIGYRELLQEYIDQRELEEPILTEQIVKYAAGKIAQKEAVVRKAVNVNMARLEKSGQVARIAKGVYCRQVPTAFGHYAPNRETVFCKQLLYNEDKIIGYETGLSALNRIGLVSQMPRQRYIATNLYTKKAPAGIQVEIRKPPVLVDDTNYRYLQLLDMIKEIDDAPIDTPKPVQVIRGAAEELALNTDLLILMARRYYNQKTLLRTIDILLGGHYETA